MAILFATETSAGSPIAFKLVRGTEWEDDFQLTDQATGDPIDLTGVVRIVMRIRKTIGSAVVLELSTTDSTLVVTTALTGSVGIRVDTATTNTFPTNNHKRAKYVYDALIERTAGEYEPAIGGKVTVLPSVTRLADDV